MTVPMVYLFIYLALPTRAGSPQQHMPITVGPFELITRFHETLTTNVPNKVGCEVQKFILEFTSQFVNKVSDWSLK